MSKSKEFRLTVRCDNAVFEPEPWGELARILRNAADKLEEEREECRWFQTIRDANGNEVGQFALKNASYFDNSLANNILPWLLERDAGSL